MGMQVDICNLTLAVEGLANATYRSPTWLPKYPATQSFKAGTYVPFTVILPLDLHSSSYPSVDVLEGFYACDAALKPLPEDQVVPPLPSGTGRSGTAASNDHHPGAASNTGLKSKIKWEPGLMASAGSERACLRDCLDTLNKHTDDCAGMLTGWRGIRIDSFIDMIQALSLSPHPQPTPTHSMLHTQPPTTCCTLAASRAARTQWPSGRSMPARTPAARPNCACSRPRAPPPSSTPRASRLCSWRRWPWRPPCSLRAEAGRGCGDWASFV